MSDFLDFLNTADPDTLTKIPGINRALAENIIAARPFDFVEDCQHVEGMDKNLLGRAQSYFESELNESRNGAVIPNGSEISEPPDAASFRSRLGEAFNNVLRSALRLLITLAAIVIIGTALYYGLPYINEKFMAPVEQNSAQIDRLEAQLSVMQAQLDELNTRTDALEKSLEAQTASLDRLKVMQSALEETLHENNDVTMLALKQEIMTTRALELLGRARLYLAQNNFGPARGDIRAARELLVTLHTETGDAMLEPVIARLDQTLGNLPAFPEVAAGNLEIAWQLLITSGASSAVTPQVIFTFTPTPETSATSTP